MVSATPFRRAEFKSAYGPKYVSYRTRWSRIYIASHQLRSGPNPTTILPAALRMRQDGYADASPSVTSSSPTSAAGPARLCSAAGTEARNWTHNAKKVNLDVGCQTPLDTNGQQAQASYHAVARCSFRLALFGGAAGVAALLFTSGIPRIQRDILDKIPGMGKVYEKEIHPQDNPF
ncbi:hypothetical protein LLEC1_06720 [Akanthomyces lecanii]|uniref:Uncharacterized protein n=1 Tax=Cordyceps confragosa TaxID=2714763 RepID=A0A179HZA8_CORDF|nr:hypothetical protein LLEC1_06720 [Akanthomyces lecanii]